MWLLGFACHATRRIWLVLALLSLAGQSLATPDVVAADAATSHSRELRGFSSLDIVTRRADALNGQADDFSRLQPKRPEPFPPVVELAQDHPYRITWKNLGSRIAAERRVLDYCRREPEICPVPASQFLQIVDAARLKAGRAALGEINRAINLALKPVKDVAQHGVLDVWTAPLAAFSAGQGDCEDYAIAKYVALQEAGVPAHDLRFVIVHNTRLREDHAVVAARLGTQWLILDNTRFALLEDAELPDYLGLLSINDDQAMT
jgi:predicted transglutaminase-like cysteine proteinase